MKATVFIEPGRGRITVNNVQNRTARYEIRLALLNGEEIVETVEIALEDGKPRCTAADGGTENTREWTTRSPRGARHDRRR